MAALTSTTTAQDHTSLTPPSSSHGQDSWNYSVPAHLEPSSPSISGYHISRQFSPTNASELRPSTDTFGPRPTDSGHIVPARVNALTRQDSNLSDTGSAPDSLLDLYGQNKTGRNNMGSSEVNDINGDERRNSDSENSRWIHRDKLAKIESEEMQAAGIILPRPRTASKSSRRRSPSREHGTSSRNEGQRRKRMGTSSGDDGDDTPAWDLRLPEEVAEANGNAREVAGTGKGISRIPVSKTSPLPIPTDYLERDTPIPRKASGGWFEEDANSFSKARGRSHSVKSSLDDASFIPSPNPLPAPIISPVPKLTPATARASPAEPSPTKKPRRRKGSIGTNAALPSNATEKNTTRQASGQRPKHKSPSDARSKSRTGDLTSAVSRRPEGDPPWLASMYKPDPRLPPDQQVIPTHAKRMQQEQWEKEGKFTNIYDTSFRPLNQEEPRSRPISTLLPSETSDPAFEEEPKPEPEPELEWPLSIKPPTKSRSPRIPEPQSPVSPASPVSPQSPTLSTGARSMSSAANAGTYSTMPKIHPTTSKPQGVTLPDPKPETIRVQEPPESSKKAGCGCCAVM